MSNKHTPGPWQWRGYRNGDAWELYGSDDDVVCDDGSNGGEYSGWMKSPDEPNARPISAAPELLEALEELLSREWQDDDGVPTLEAARSNARAAIAKARGQS